MTAPSGFVCISCGRTSFDMSAAPMCHKCRGAPLRVPVIVDGPRMAVLATLVRLGHDVGSVDARKVDPEAAAHQRLFCVALVDDAAIATLGEDLRRELVDDDTALALTDRCMVLPLPLDARLVVFLDMPTLAAPTY
jgi:hypothetical protein